MRQATVCVAAWLFGVAGWAAIPADLIVLDVEAPSTVALGGRMDVGVHIHNQGGETAPGGFTVRILASSDDRIDSNSTVIDTYTETRSLGADENWYVVRSVQTPHLAGGLSYVGALVDAGGTVTESREDNNYGVARFATDVVPRRYTMRRAWVFDPTPNANGDREANPGERVLVSVRLRHDGPGDAERVRVSLSSSDSDVTVLRTGLTLATWAAGATRTSTGHVLRISPTATPHNVPIEVTVTTGPHVALGNTEEDGDEYEGRWVVGVVIPIVTRPPELVMRNQWVYDPLPALRQNGEANPGERIYPRIRLKNLGGTAENVRVALTVADTDLTVLNGEVLHPTWTARDARDNVGLMLGIHADATAHDVAIRVDVTADNGGPWRFDYTIPIVVPGVEFARRSVWVFDPQPLGNGDREANPGERVYPRVRLRSVGRGVAENVRVELSLDDPDVHVIQAVVAHATWEEGAARTSSGFALDIAPGATAHDVVGTVVVTADNGGPWEFTVVIPLVELQRVFIKRNDWVFDPAPGGNKDGQANPGERIRPRLRLKNVGSADGEDVRVSLTIDDADITI
ncbi:MAG: CARDB domain-containing protein, partial [Candidatus Poribacteria bacterium]